MWCSTSIVSSIILTPCQTSVLRFQVVLATRGIRKFQFHRITWLVVVCWNYKVYTIDRKSRIVCVNNYHSSKLFYDSTPGTFQTYYTYCHAITNWITNNTRFMKDSSIWMSCAFNKLKVWNRCTSEEFQNYWDCRQQLLLYYTSWNTSRHAHFFLYKHIFKDYIQPLWPRDALLVHIHKAFDN